MKRLAVIMVVLALLVFSLAPAVAQEQETENRGELSTLYWGAKVDMANTSTTWPGYIIRANFFTESPLKFGAEYTTLSKNFAIDTPTGAPAWNGALRDFKFHIKYAPWRTATYDFGVGLFYDSRNFDLLVQTAPATYQTASNSATGLGYGIDGSVKMSEKTSFYGLLDYSPSLKLSVMGQDKKLSDTTIEAGINFRTNDRLNIKVGYRNSSISGDATIKSSGLVLGLGIKY